jgi:hypothetical protein
MRQRGFSDKTVKYSGQEKELRGAGGLRGRYKFAADIIKSVVFLDFQ